jgi:hypothetical protein
LVRSTLLALLLCAPAITARAEPADTATATEAAARLTFDPGHARLTVAAREALKPVASAMQVKTTLRIVIVGHGDTGLARRRADVVKWFFVDAGVESDRIDTRVNPAPGSPIELQFQSVAARREGTAVRTTPVVRALRPMPAVHSKVEVRAETSPSGAGSIDDSPQVAGLFDDTSVRRTAGADLDRQIEAARNAQVTIGGSASGSRDTAPPQLGVRTLELSISSVGVSGPVERHEEVARIRYRADEAPDAGTRASIRAQRHGR